MDNLLDIFLVIVSVVGIASASYVVAKQTFFVQLWLWLYLL